jgi:hypothetical protein
MALVVMRSPFEKFTAGQRKDAIIIAGGADVRVVSMVADALFSSSVSPANLLGGVGGGIITKNKFKIFKILLEKAIQGSSEVPFPVEDRKPNANFR